MNEFQQFGIGQASAPQQFSPQSFPQQQLAPQGWLGSMIGAPLGGLAGRAIGGLFDNPQLGGQIGQYAGGIGGSFLPLSAGPGQGFGQGGQQQAFGGQVAPQAWPGDLLGGLLGNIGIVKTAITLLNSLAGLLPVVASALPPGSPIAQRLQQVHQVLQQLQQVFHLQSQQGMQPQMLQQPFQQQQPQQIGQGLQGQQAQGQLAPQGWLGDALGQVGRPLGGLIGGIAGNQQLGNTIGGISSALGGLLPFSADPFQLQQLAFQQALQAQQGQAGAQQFQPGQYPAYQGNPMAQAYGQPYGQGFGQLQGGGQQPGGGGTLH